MNSITLTSEMGVELVQYVGSDAGIVAAARVSTLGAKAAPEESAGLLRYLLRHRHGTPFEHASLTFRIHAPLFVWRQIHRHRIGFSFNEESGRYKRLDPVFWVPRRDRPMTPSPYHKPARPSFVRLEGDGLYAALLAHLRESYEVAWGCYERFLSCGVASEVARVVLPTAVYSHCYVTCNPRSLMHFLSLRVHDPEATFISYPQKEVEEVAQAMERIFCTLFPLTHQAFLSCGRVAP